jgi:ligand-binding sensor domain-containing protein/signal transduction histidine kinase
MNGSAFFCITRITILCLLLCNFHTHVSAQRYPFFNLNVENGLIQSQATSLVQDKYGHLWIGTLGGLSRYDGKTLTNYSVRDGLSDNTINTLATDNKGNIWIGTPVGISKFNGAQFKHYSIYSDNALSPASVAEIKIANNGMIWFRAGGIVYHIAKDTILPLPIPDSNGFASAILADGNNLWIAKTGGVVYQYADRRWDSLLLRIPGRTTTPSIYKIFKDKNGRILITTNAGLFTITDNGIHNVSVNGNATYDLPPLLSAAEGKSGDLWFGTTSGAVRMTDTSIEYYTKRNGLVDNAILSTLTDTEGNIWLASDGTGVFRFSGTQFTVLDESMGLPSAQVMSMATTNNGRKMYIGTYEAGLFIYEGETVYAVTLPVKPAPSITAIKNRQGKSINELWFGTRGAGLWKYDGRSFSSFGTPDLPSNSITSLYIDDSNRLFIGCINGAAYYHNNAFYRMQLLNTIVQDFVNIGHDSILIATNNGIKLFHDKQIHTFTTNTILDSISAQCFVIKDDELWTGSSDNGIIRYNIKTRKAIVINKENGLYSDFIYNIITDNDGNIWTGTGFGIHKISITNGKTVISFYGKGQGVAGMESNHNAVLKMSDGSIWFGTTNGALHYSPRSTAVRPEPVSLIMQSVKLFGEQIADTSYYNSIDPWYKVPQGLKLPYKKNNLTFNFQAITLSGSEQIKYRYRIEGLDAPWSEWSAINAITYPALPPGKYKLIIEATAAGSETKTLTYPFEIITPFHKTTWFTLIITVGFILIGITIQYIISRRKHNRLALLDRLRREEQAKVRLRTAEDFHDEVGNKLTRINVLTNVLKEKLSDRAPVDTNRIIEQIQDNTALLYSGTRDILWSLKPTNDNLYEILHRLRDFGGELFQDTDVDFIFAGTDEHWRLYKLPLDVSRNLIMIFKEALNNSLKYSGANTVRLEASLIEDHTLQIALNDDGEGFDPQNVKKGHGIDNMKVRANRINGILQIISEPGKGARIKLDLPLPRK